MFLMSYITDYTSLTELISTLLLHSSSLLATIVPILSLSINFSISLQGFYMKISFFLVHPY